MLKAARSRRIVPIEYSFADSLKLRQGARKSRADIPQTLSEAIEVPSIPHMPAKLGAKLGRHVLFTIDIGFASFRAIPRYAR
jgi:hypothetical protein